MKPGMAPAEVLAFASLVRQGLGLSVDDMPVPSLTEALARRAAVHGWPPRRYVSWLAGNLCWPETGGLASELTVSETYFFRDTGQLRAFTEHVLPERGRARAADRRLRILSAGCSTGEEPYSLAMLMRESQLMEGWDTSISGLDVNPRVIAHALRGRYSEWSLRQTSDLVRERWFRKDGREYVLDPAIRAAVTFRERNLVVGEVAADDGQGYDVIFCRNMLMYLTPENFTELAAKLTRALAPGGFLFLGHAETLRGLPVDLQLCNVGEAFCYQRPPSRLRGTAGPTSGHTLPARALPLARGRTRAGQLEPPRQPVMGQAAAEQAVARAGREAPPPDLSLPLALFLDERFGDALAALDALASEPAAHLDTTVLRAVVLAAAGDLPAAEAQCRRLVGVAGYDARAHHVLAACREAAGDEKGAIRHNRLATHLDPSFAMPRLHLGLLARRAGDVGAARGELTQALTLITRERADRVRLFGGGFSRHALIEMCKAELSSCGGGS